MGSSLLLKWITPQMETIQHRDETHSSFNVSLCSWSKHRYTHLQTLRQVPQREWREVKNFTKLRIYWPLATVFLRCSLMPVLNGIEGKGNRKIGNRRDHKYDVHRSQLQIIQQIIFCCWHSFTHLSFNMYIFPFLDDKKILFFLNTLVATIHCSLILLTITGR